MKKSFVLLAMSAAVLSACGSSGDRNTTINNTDNSVVDSNNGNNSNNGGGNDGNTINNPPPVVIPPVVIPPKEETPVKGNTAPISNASNDQAVITGSTVELDGSSSSDPDGDKLIYVWKLTKPDGSSGILIDDGTAKPKFVADMTGEYVVTLVVNDGQANSPQATVKIAANPEVSFDSIYPKTGYNVPSMGAEAYAFKSIGDSIKLKSAAPLTLETLSVEMSSWACEVGGVHTKDCATVPGHTYSVPITLDVYDGYHNKVLTVTQRFDIPYRPSTDPTCGTGWRAADGKCYNGRATIATFDLTAFKVKLPNADMSFQISYNTAHYGPNPLGVASPADSLNVGLGAAPLAPRQGAYLQPGSIGDAGDTDRYNVLVQVTTTN